MSVCAQTLHKTNDVNSSAPCRGSEYAAVKEVFDERSKRQGAVLERLQPGALVEALARQAEESEQAADSVQVTCSLLFLIPGSAACRCAVYIRLGCSHACAAQSAARHASTAQVSEYFAGVLIVPCAGCLCTRGAQQRGVRGAIYCSQEAVSPA